MSFVQIIECRTSRIDELQKLDDEWLSATEGRRTLRRSIIAQDRNDSSRYLVLAFFDSFDDAMENSNLPETGEIAAKMAALADGPMTFHDLDVIEDQSF
jgi:hypothetical protein